MVIPMPSLAGSAGDPPEQILPHLQKIKWTIIVTFFASLGQLLTGSFPLNEVFYVISGTFLMKNDRHTGRGYNLLMSSPLSSCAGPTGGGMSCLTPLMFLGGINVLFSIFSIMRVISGLLSGNLNSIFVLSCFIAQAVGVYYAYLSFDYLRGEAGPTGALPGLPGNNNSARNYQPPSRTTASSGTANAMTLSSSAQQSAGNGNAPEPTSTNFVAFSGEGNKLGET